MSAQCPPVAGPGAVRVVGERGGGRGGRGLSGEAGPAGGREGPGNGRGPSDSLCRRPLGAGGARIVGECGLSSDSEVWCRHRSAGKGRATGRLECLGRRGWSASHCHRRSLSRCGRVISQFELEQERQRRCSQLRASRTLLRIDSDSEAAQACPGLHHHAASGSVATDQIESDSELIRD